MTQSISSGSLHNLLGIPPDTPLTIDEMCRTIKPVLYPAPQLSLRLTQFCSALVAAMQSLGITVASKEEACGDNGRFASGTVILAPGYFSDSELPINHVTTLYNNIIVGIYDEPAPLTPASLPQQRLDAIVGRLARDMVHILVFVTDRSWTICTMNGGVITFNTPYPLQSDVQSTLIPKLTAQVVPPTSDKFTIEHGALKSDTPLFRDVSGDFLECSALWSNNAALLTHTSTEGLQYRNIFYQRIVARYLDQRSGMSYGFFARQLPVAVQAARLSEGADVLSIRLLDRVVSVPIPDISVITTRSGCKKNYLDPEKDLLEIGLLRRHGKGVAYIKTSAGVPETNAARPSFDTLTILAHALGNALTASILMTLRPDALFPYYLARSGASITHWHDYPNSEQLPEGYYLHGNNNPPVACSTPQSAAYSLLGKISALEQALEEGNEYLGDVHIEPNHGTNIVGVLSLAETAKLLNPVHIPERVSGIISEA